MSKWYLAIGSLESGIPVINWLGPVVLLISALLTAAYLLPITIKGFFPGNNFDYSSLEKKEPGACMLIPLILLAILSGFTIFSGSFITLFQGIITPLLGGVGL